MAKPNGPTDVAGGFKVKIKDGSGTTIKYLKHDLSLDANDGECWDGYLHYGTTYVYVDTNGSLATTTAPTYWTLNANKRLTYSANDTTYYLIQNATGTAVAVQTTEPSTGHTIKTEDC